MLLDKCITYSRSIRSFSAVIKLYTNKREIFHKCERRYSEKSALILGIETSCDDTGCAVINDAGKVLGEALHSQHLIHLRSGGIVPPVAEELHRENIEPVVEKAIYNAGITYEDLSAIAVTVKPGLTMSLKIGMKYGKYLARTYNKPFIPIHHMEAHALVARMEHNVPFPFLVLLISGGHCLLAVAQDVNKFQLLGTSTDDSPGEAFDKTARRMKLRNIKEYSTMSGGQAIELAASRSINPGAFTFPNVMESIRDCNFSMSGLKYSALKKLIEKEKEHDIMGDGVIPEINDLCAGFQLGIARHLCQRTQRAMEYAKLRGLLPNNNKHLVVSGGVACNEFIARALKVVCDENDFTVVRPSKALCTDNGVMIAWNGLERWRKQCGIVHDLDGIDIQSTAPLGESLIDDVIKSNIYCSSVKLKDLLQPTMYMAVT